MKRRLNPGFRNSSISSGENEMYTSFDKAIVGFIMGAVGIANLFGIHFGLSADTVSSIVAVLTPILVYLIPNLPKDS